MENNNLPFCMCRLIETQNRNDNGPIYKTNESLPNWCNNKSHTKYIPIGIIAKYLAKKYPNLINGTHSTTKTFEYFSRLDIGIHLVAINKKNKQGELYIALYVGYRKDLDNLSNPTNDKKLTKESIRKEAERYLKTIRSIDIDSRKFINLEKAVNKEQISRMDSGIMDIVTKKYTLTDESKIEEVILDIVESSVLRILHDKSNFRVDLFGSRKLGLNTIKSDLDIVINFSKGIKVPLNKFIDTLTKVFRKEGYIAHKISATVPLIKLTLYTEEDRELLVDISFENTFGIVKNLMVNAYIHSDPRVRPLLIAVREWAANRDIVDGSFLVNSYSYMMLILAFLCESGVLLPFKNMIDILIPLYLDEATKREPDSIDEMLESEMKNMNLNKDDSSKTRFKAKAELLKKEVGYSLWMSHKKNEKNVLKNLYIRWKTSNNKSISELLIEFFRYYGFEHDYENNIISVREGTTKLKRNIEADQIKKSAGWINNSRLLTIEDPLEIEKDCGRNLAVGKLEGIRSEMRRSYFILRYGSILVSDTNNLVPIVMAKYKYSNPVPLEYWISEYDISLPVFVDVYIDEGNSESDSEDNEDTWWL
ncbi:hypothetical protein BB559_000751 [Furculomyces boomerangus]|uniref:polynucleotide adenylyltransferase n=1 Tax=Furculomyces boomerangus TaxID=61424 RepID=A0A2T9Z476_9FUNG|nr:hypothetical protein BB559_000751 [Furculomyces boomerangus]